MTHTAAYRWARKVAIGVIGFTVLLVGLAMVVLPGPAFIVVPAGLAILGLEFAWARAWLRRVRAMIPARVMPPCGPAQPAHSAASPDPSAPRTPGP